MELSPEDQKIWTPIYNNILNSIIDAHDLPYTVKSSPRNTLELLLSKINYDQEQKIFYWFRKYGGPTIEEDLQGCGESCYQSCIYCENKGKKRSLLELGDLGKMDHTKCLNLLYDNDIVQERAISRRPDFHAAIYWTQWLNKNKPADKPTLQGKILFTKCLIFKGKEIFPAKASFGNIELYDPGIELRLTVITIGATLSSVIANPERLFEPNKTRQYNKFLHAKFKGRKAKKWDKIAYGSPSPINQQELLCDKCYHQCYRDNRYEIVCGRCGFVQSQFKLGDNTSWKSYEESTSDSIDLNEDEILTEAYITGEYIPQISSNFYSSGKYRYDANPRKHFTHYPFLKKAFWTGYSRKCGISCNCPVEYVAKCRRRGSCKKCNYRVELSLIEREQGRLKGEMEGNRTFLDSKYSYPKLCLETIKHIPKIEPIEVVTSHKLEETIAKAVQARQIINDIKKRHRIKGHKKALEEPPSYYTINQVRTNPAKTHPWENLIPPDPRTIYAGTPVGDALNESFERIGKAMYWLWWFANELDSHIALAKASLDYGPYSDEVIKCYAGVSLDPPTGANIIKAFMLKLTDGFDLPEHEANAEKMFEILVNSKVLVRLDRFSIREPLYYLNKTCYCQKNLTPF